MTSTIRPITRNVPLTTNEVWTRNFLKDLSPTLESAITSLAIQERPKPITFEFQNKKIKSILSSKPKWKDKDYRVSYMESACHQTIAWQIRQNRESRGLTQSELAEMTGTGQSAISRAEDTEYENHSLATLKKVAEAFDCALLVKFVSYSELAYESNFLSKEHLYACSYEDEIRENLLEAQDVENRAYSLR